MPSLSYYSAARDGYVGDNLLNLNGLLPFLIGHAGFNACMMQREPHMIVSIAR